MGIIAGAIGVSSNGRTRDFGSLYHGSNPCAPTSFIKAARKGGFYKMMRRPDCNRSFLTITAKRY